MLAPDTSTIPSLCTVNSFLKEKCNAPYKSGKRKAAKMKETDVIVFYKVNKK